MFLDRLDGHLFPVEDTCSQSGFHICLFKDFTEVFNLSGTGGGYYTKITKLNLVENIS